MSIEIGKLACWRRAPGGVWVIWGRFDLLMDSLDGGDPVQVQARSGEITEVPIERVTKPNQEGFSYAWPAGTVTGEFSGPIEITPVRPRSPKTKVRLHTSRDANRRKRARMR